MPVVAQRIGMIGSEDHDRVVEVAFALEHADDLAHLLIDHRDVRGIVPPHAEQSSAPAAFPLNRVEIEFDHVLAQDFCAFGCASSSASVTSGTGIAAVSYIS